MGYTSDMREVEKKYLVHDKEKLMNYLKDAKFIKEKHQKDIYYDTELGDLNAKGYYIRVRNDERFDFKFDMGDDVKHEFCEEVNFSYPLKQDELEKINNLLVTYSLKPVSRADLQEITKANNLLPLVPIEKHREYYEKHGLTFCIDEVKDLGSFVEVEKITTTDKVDETLKEIDAVMSNLNFKLIPTGYIELYLKRFLPEAYARGRYKISDEIWK